MFNVPAFLDSLQYMAKGMTGVFLVIAAIILSIYLLNRVFTVSYTHLTLPTILRV